MKQVLVEGLTHHIRLQKTTTWIKKDTIKMNKIWKKNSLFSSINSCSTYRGWWRWVPLKELRRSLWWGMTFSWQRVDMTHDFWITSISFVYAVKFGDRCIKEIRSMCTRWLEEDALQTTSGFLDLSWDDKFIFIKMMTQILQLLKIYFVLWFTVGWWGWICIFRFNLWFIFDGLFII